jgi:2-polyprenyl-6-methoxyphenol hydroxylase-like FAD-dependent oxidoreductase
MSQVSTRTMEFCRHWGIAGEVKKAGWPETHPGDIIYVTAMVGHEIFRQKFASYKEQRDLGYTPEGPRQCPQIFFDPILLRRAGSLPSVTLRYRAEVESFEASRDGVQARVQSLETGHSETIRSEYLVGCDGFDGLVRKALNTRYEGSGLLSYSLSIFFRSTALGELHDKGWGRFYRLVDGSGHWSDLVAIEKTMPQSGTFLQLCRSGARAPHVWIREDIRHWICSVTVSCCSSSVKISRM